MTTVPGREEGQDATDAAAQQPPHQRFKFVARPVSVSTDTPQSQQGAKEADLSLYLLQLNSLPEETDALQYWLSKESQYANIAQLALDLVCAPASQAYVERVFSVCGDLSARKRNRASVGLESRVFLKLNKRELARVNL